MKRIATISIILASGICFFSLQSYLIAASESDGGSISQSECGCELKEALKKGDWPKAAESAEKLIQNAPDSNEAKEAYLLLGLYHKSRHDFSKSMTYYQKAIDKFPDSWTSAEAHARIGCNHYKLNNLNKALEYFHVSGFEAKTWQQKKYASTWAKWVRFSLARQEKQSVDNCVTRSISQYMASQGKKFDAQKFASSLKLKDGLVSLSAVMRLLEKEDVNISALKCPLGRIKELPMPIVAVVKPSHMIVIKKVGDRIKVYDPFLGEVFYYEKELAEIWEEKVLTASIPSDKKFASVDKKDLNKIFLGACYCCPQAGPLNPCDSDSDNCSACNGGEGPGGPGDGGGSGGGRGGSGPGCGKCYASGYGFPRMSVYMPSLTLMVRDTPIGYSFWFLVKEQRTNNQELFCHRFHSFFSDTDSHRF